MPSIKDKKVDPYVSGAPVVNRPAVGAAIAAFVVIVFFLCGYPSLRAIHDTGGEGLSRVALIAPPEPPLPEIPVSVVSPEGNSDAEAAMEATEVLDDDSSDTNPDEDGETTDTGQW